MHKADRAYAHPIGVSLGDMTPPESSGREGPLARAARLLAPHGARGLLLRPGPRGLDPRALGDDGGAGGHEHRLGPGAPPGRPGDGDRGHQPRVPRALPPGHRSRAAGVAAADGHPSREARHGAARERDLAAAAAGRRAGDARGQAVRPRRDRHHAPGAGARSHHARRDGPDAARALGRDRRRHALRRAGRGRLLPLGDGAGREGARGVGPHRRLDGLLDGRPDTGGSRRCRRTCSSAADPRLLPGRVRREHPHGRLRDLRSGQRDPRARRRRGNGGRDACRVARGPDARRHPGRGRREDPPLARAGIDSICVFLPDEQLERATLQLVGEEVIPAFR